MTYTELQLIVDGDKVTATRQDGVEAYGNFRLSDLHKALLAVFDRWLREKEVDRRADFEALGSLLYETLLDRDVDALLAKTLSDIDGEGRLRLQLVFRRESLHLARIPWEFLFRPHRTNETGFFLATHPKLVLSRYVPLNLSREALGGVSPLRFLLVISEPRGEDKTGGDLLLRQLKALSAENQIEISTLGKPTIKHFLARIEDFKPHMIHLAAHGKYEPGEEEGQIAFLKDDLVTAAFVSDHTFVDCFQRWKPSFVFLQACEGGAVDFSANFAGVAARLAHLGIGAVVAMQFPIDVGTAVAFASDFYEQLARPEPVDGAVQEARRNITLITGRGHASREFGTPVLYIRSRDGTILPRAAKP
jgi:hypothetical protein